MVGEKIGRVRKMVPGQISLVGCCGGFEPGAPPITEVENAVRNDMAADRIARGIHVGDERIDALAPDCDTRIREQIAVAEALAVLSIEHCSALGRKDRSKQY